jgi:hypothetical protein
MFLVSIEPDGKKKNSGSENDSTPVKLKPLPTF